MSKKEAEIAKCHKAMDKLGVKYDAKAFANVFTACGPSVYRTDASKVSSSDEKELNTVKKGFIAKKLGITDEAKADKAIASVVETFGKSNKNKHRAIFYYLLAKELKKISTFK